MKKKLLFFLILSVVTVFFSITTKARAGEIRIGLFAPKLEKGIYSHPDYNFQEIEDFSPKEIKKIFSSPPVLIKSGEDVVEIRVTVVTLKNGRRYCYLTAWKIPEKLFKRLLFSPAEGEIYIKKIP